MPISLIVQVTGALTIPIQREDLEFSVGSKAAVWEVKDPLLTTSVGDYDEDTTSNYHAGGTAASLVGGVSGNQIYGGKGGYPQGGYSQQPGYGGVPRGYPPTSERY